MPTYEYTCKTCGERFDIVQSFSAKPLKKHPGACGGPVQKVFHASGIVFKGSGFYVTDSRGSSSVKTASDSSGSTTKSSKSDTSSKTGSSSKTDSSD
jgi:putative FmdB family regulatory protein